MLRLFLFALIVSLTSVVCTLPDAYAQQPVPGDSGGPAYSREVTLQLKTGTELLRQGKLPEARQAFQRALEMEPKCHEAWNNIGLTYYNEGNLDKAGDAYMNAIEIEPSFVPSITNLGAVRHQQHKLDKATGLYKLALDLSNGKDPEIQYNYANVLRDQKDYSNAKKHYLASIELRPEFPAAHNGLGATYFCLKNFADAEREIKYAIKLKPDYALAYYHLGLLEAARQRYPEAISAYEESLKHEDRKDYADDTRAKIARLRELMEKGTSASIGGPPMLVKSIPPGEGMSGNSSTPAAADWKFGDASKRFEQLLRSGKGNDPVMWNNLGLMLLHEGPAKSEEAIDAFKKAITLSRGSLYQSEYNLAQAYRQKGDLINAEKQCDKAIASAKGACPLVHNLKAILLKQKGQLAKADDQYKLAISQGMDRYPVFYYNRAVLLEKMNKNKEAKQHYKSYIDKAPSGANFMKAKLRLGLLNI